MTAEITQANEGGLLSHNPRKCPLWCCIACRVADGSSAASGSATFTELQEQKIRPGMILSNHRPGQVMNVFMCFAVHELNIISV